MNAPAFPRHVSAALLVASLGCADYAVNSKGDSELSAPEQDGNGVSDYLRVDIYPSDQNPDLLPETHILDEEWEGLTVEMLNPVTLAGEVWGYDATPYLGIDVPGSSIPIDARVSFYRQGTIVSAGAVTQSEQDGAFSISLPRGDDYTFSVVPIDPSQLPFLVEQHVIVRADSEDELIELDYGVPVFGHITNSSGLELDSLALEVALLHPATNTKGPSVQPDERGYYQLRALAGMSYQVVLSGAQGELVPTVRQEIVLESDEGGEIDFQLGSLEPIDVDGQVISSTSAAVEGATVRFSSLELDDFPGGELEVDDITSSRGEYRLSLLPGRYHAEFIAPASLGLCPSQAVLDLHASEDGEDYDVQLSALTTIESQVLGPGGEPLAGVTVVAIERGFDGYTYTATTDKAGYFSLAVPEIKLQFILTPPEGEASVTYVEVPVEEFPSIIMLEQGDAISGNVHHGDEPVAFALLEVRNSEDQLYATTLTDENGDFQVRVRWLGGGGEIDVPLDTGL